MSVIVAIEKGATRSYRLALSLPYLISITDIADCGWPSENKNYNYYTFLNGDVTLSHKAVVEERFDSIGQLSERSLDPVYMEWGTPV